MEELKGNVKVVQVRELRRLLKTLLDAGEPVIVCRNSRTCGVLLPLVSGPYRWRALERRDRIALRDGLAQVLNALGAD